MTFDDWMVALCERTAHEQACPPCLTYDPTTRCPIGRRLAESEQTIYHRHFLARFAQEEVSDVA